VRFSSTALFYSKRVKDVEAFSGFTSWGCVSAIDSEGRTIWAADGHRDGGKRFVVRADDKLTAFLELEWAIRAAEHPEHCGAREITVDGLSPCW
jgi:hypothetical protein